MNPKSFNQIIMKTKKTSSVVFGGILLVVVFASFWWVESGRDESGTVDEVTQNTPVPAAFGDRWPVAEARFVEMESAIADLRDERAQSIDHQKQALWTTAELQPAIADLTSRVAGLEESAPSLYEGLDLASMASTVEALMLELDQLSKRIDGIDRLTRRNRQVRKSANAQPPFRAEAIDWWGDTPSVVILDGGRTRFLSPGDSFAGWRLTGVDPDAQGAIFERDGKRARVAVSP